MTSTPEDLWLPISPRAKHDEPITAEALARREWARKQAEENIARVFEQHYRDRDKPR